MLTGLRFGRFLYGPKQAITRIVDEYVDAAEVCVGLGDRGKIRVPVVDVQFQGKNGIPILLNKIIECAYIPGRCGHFVSPFQKGFRPDFTKPAGSACNKDCLCHLFLFVMTKLPAPPRGDLS